MSEIERTSQWFVTAGQMPEKPEPDARQIAFYMGMQMEELAEKMALVFGSSNTLVAQMDSMGNDLKLGTFDYGVEKAFYAQPGDFLDADCDLMWVTIGAAQAQGANFSGAYNTVTTANWQKFPGGVVTRNPANGKIVKPAGWEPPNLLPFLHSHFQGVL